MANAKLWKATWRERAEDLKTKLAAIQKQFNETQAQLASAQHDLALAEKMGFADDNLPDNYGELICERHPGSEYAEEIKSMTEAGDKAAAVSAAAAGDK